MPINPAAKRRTASSCACGENFIPSSQTRSKRPKTKAFFLDGGRCRALTCRPMKRLWGQRLPGRMRMGVLLGVLPEAARAGFVEALGRIATMVPSANRTGPDRGLLAAE